MPVSFRMRSIRLGGYTGRPAITRWASCGSSSMKATGRRVWPMLNAWANWLPARPAP
ncbi:hypothetical protein D3C80_2010950 [compost metagenome]